MRYIHFASTYISHTMACIKLARTYYIRVDKCEISFERMIAKTCAWQNCTYTCIHIYIKFVERPLKRERKADARSR